jgi:hypothetical protein
MNNNRFEINDVVKVTSFPRREYFRETGRIVGHIAQSEWPHQIVYAVEFPSRAMQFPFFGFELESVQRPTTTRA